MLIEGIGGPQIVVTWPMLLVIITAGVLIAAISRVFQEWSISRRLNSHLSSMESLLKRASMHGDSFDAAWKAADAKITTTRDQIVKVDRRVADVERRVDRIERTLKIEE